jgi:hypothetical protein
VTTQNTRSTDSFSRFFDSAFSLATGQINLPTAIESLTPHLDAVANETFSECQACDRTLTDANWDGHSALCDTCRDITDAPYCCACGQPCSVHRWTENMSESSMFPSRETFAESVCCRADVAGNRDLTEPWEGNDK